MIAVELLRGMLGDGQSRRQVWIFIGLWISFVSTELRSIARFENRVRPAIPVGVNAENLFHRNRDLFSVRRGDVGVLPKI